MIRRNTTRRWSAALGTVAIVCVIIWQAAEKRAAASDTNDSHREPILRIETGMHVAAIWGMGIDAENNYLVTASEDKSIRAWQLPSGRPVRVIRPPIGEGKDGMVMALAVSPTSQTIAAALHGPPGGVSSIDVFELQTGKLIKRLVGLRDFAHHLAFSGDGRYLAATLFSGDVIVYDTSSYALIAEDRTCTSDSFDGVRGAERNYYGVLRRRYSRVRNNQRFVTAHARESATCERKVSGCDSSVTGRIGNRDWIRRYSEN
jgi:WD40 repeat protein